MVNVKNHAKIRYCQRVLGIESDNEIKQYIAQNDNKIVNDLNKMYEYSQFIYKGAIGDNLTRIYKMADNVVLVLNSQENAIITLFKCIFDFGEEMDRQIIKHELEVIRDLNEQLENIDIGIEEFIEDRKIKSENISIQLKALEEQMKILKQQKLFIDEEIKNKRTDRNYTLKELEKRAVRICNSIEYRSDLNEKAI